jgi:hypothetical protein
LRADGPRPPTEVIIACIDENGAAILLRPDCARCEAGISAPNPDFKDAALVSYYN